MGGKIPRSIDIHSPRLSTKVTIDVPEGEELQNGSLYRVFKRENILNLCMNALRKVPDWDYLMESQLAKGKSLQLAWRVDANLDWIWLETDVSEKPRDWAVLCGLPFKHVGRNQSLLAVLTILFVLLSPRGIRHLRSVWPNTTLLTYILRIADGSMNHRPSKVT